MVDPIPTSVKRAWDDWNLQVCMLLSLSLQTFLILFAPLRTRTANLFLMSLIWSAYLLADSVALYAIGQISSSRQANATINSDLLVFWAPFLLMHLGGPDTITAFSLEDNALWLRHFFDLISQVVPAIYVFVQSLPSNKLFAPTTLLLLAGIIKYAERTRALYLASFDAFAKSMQKEADPGNDYATYMENFAARKKVASNYAVHLQPDGVYAVELCEVDDVDYISAVQHAHSFFEIFKGALVDLVFSTQERLESQQFFFMRNSEVAFKVISIEFNFMYQVLYTKVVAVRSKLGYIFRFISFCAVVVALFLFNSLEKRMSLHSTDVGITYTLLYGAISLDAIAFLMLVFSDWTVVALLRVQGKFRSSIEIVFRKYLKLRRPNLSSAEQMKSSNLLDWVRRILFRRWSESVSSYNLIDYCLKECSISNPNIFDYCSIIHTKVIDLLGLKEIRVRVKYVSTKPLSEELWDFIFKSLKYPEDSKTSLRLDDFVLRSSDWKDHCKKAANYMEHVDGYDKSLLMWHIATEICYNTDDDPEVSTSTDQKKSRREFSKVLSDYMLYLLVMQPTVMSLIAGIGQKRVQDTCAEAKRFFSQRSLGPRSTQEQACRRILQVDTEISPSLLKADTCKSVLFDACILAKRLKEELKEKKWDRMSNVWVELLAYAAGHCGPKSHAQLLSSGGQLISHVWLLMVHFGKVGQFQRSSGDYVEPHFS